MNHSTPRQKPVRSRLGLAWLFGCLLLAAGVAWGGGSASEPAQRSAPRTKRIEEIRPGEYVLAKAPRTGQVARKQVLDVFRREVDHLRHLEIEGADGMRQSIETTDEHPFFLGGGIQIAAADLVPGDLLEQADGQCALVLATCYEPHPEGIAVYNLHVEDFHTYYVAARGARAPPVWVHNTATCLAQSGLSVVLRRKMETRVLEDVHGNVVKIYGQGLRSSSKTDKHGEAIEKLAAELARTGEYEYLTLQRSWRTATGRSVGSRRIPDVIGVRRDGKIDAWEVASSTDDRKILTARLDDILNSLPLGRKGNAKVLEP